MVVISNTNADQQATNLEILAQRQTHGAKPWEPHTWGLWDISIIIINGNFEETYNWEAPRNCRIPSNELSYCQPAIVQRSRPTWVIWFSNMSLLGPWPRAVGPCVPCLDVKQEIMPQVGIINITTPNARLNILGISWREREKKQLLAYPFLAMYSIIPLTPPFETGPFTRWITARTPPEKELSIRDFTCFSSASPMITCTVGKCAKKLGKC